MEIFVHSYDSSNDALQVGKADAASKPRAKASESSISGARVQHVPTFTYWSCSERTSLLVLDNFIHSESEPEEEFLVRSGLLQELMLEANLQQPVNDWEHLLDEL